MKRPTKGRGILERVKEAENPPKWKETIDLDVFATNAARSVDEAFIDTLARLRAPFASQGDFTDEQLVTPKLSINKNGDEFFIALRWVGESLGLDTSHWSMHMTGGVRQVAAGGESLSEPLMPDQHLFTDPQAPSRNFLSINDSRCDEN